MRKSLFVLTTALTLSLLAGCSEDTDSGFANTAENLEDLVCDKSNEGQILFVKEESALFACSNGAWLATNNSSSEYSACHAAQLDDSTGYKIICGGDSLAVIYSGTKGDKGDTGATGPQGEKGDKGDTGATGATGPQGEKGDKGDTGATGAPRPQGEKGDKGDAGATGAQGEKGDKGDTGATGATGPQGEKGDKGDTGATGATGPQGEKGDKGDTGEDGTSCTVVDAVSQSGNLTGYKLICGDETKGIVWNGTPGNPGESCTAVATTNAQTNQTGYELVCGDESKGFVWNGTKGDKGDKGDQGDPCTIAPAEDGSGVILTCGEDSYPINNGTTGAKGEKGDVGATGAKGEKGDKGDDGDDGEDGVSCAVSDYTDFWVEITCGENTVRLDLPGGKAVQNMSKKYVIDATARLNLLRFSENDQQKQVLSFKSLIGDVFLFTVEELDETNFAPTGRMFEFEFDSTEIVDPMIRVYSRFTLTNIQTKYVRICMENPIIYSDSKHVFKRKFCTPVELDDNVSVTLGISEDYAYDLALRNFDMTQQQVLKYLADTLGFKAFSADEALAKTDSVFVILENYLAKAAMNGLKDSYGFEIEYFDLKSAIDNFKEEVSTRGCNAGVKLSESIAFGVMDLAFINNREFDNTGDNIYGIGEAENKLFRPIAEKSFGLGPDPSYYQQILRKSLYYGKYLYPKKNEPVWFMPSNGNELLEVYKGECTENSSESYIKETISFTPTYVNVDEEGYDYEGNYYDSDRPSIELIATCADVDDDGEYQWVIDTCKSEFKKFTTNEYENYYCDQGSWRQMTDIENEMQEKAGYTDDTRYFMCTENYNVGTMFDGFVCEGGTWRQMTTNENKLLKTASAKNEGEYTYQCNGATCTSYQSQKLSDGSYDWVEIKDYECTEDKDYKSFNIPTKGGNTFITCNAGASSWWEGGYICDEELEGQIMQNGAVSSSSVTPQVCEGGNWRDPTPAEKSAGLANARNVGEYAYVSNYTEKSYTYYINIKQDNDKYEWVEQESFVCNSENYGTLENVASKEGNFPIVCDKYSTGTPYWFMYKDNQHICNDDTKDDNKTLVNDINVVCNGSKWEIVESEP